VGFCYPPGSLRVRHAPLATQRQLLLLRSPPGEEPPTLQFPEPQDQSLNDIIVRRQTDLLTTCIDKPAEAFERAFGTPADPFGRKVHRFASAPVSDLQVM